MADYSDAIIKVRESVDIYVSEVGGGVSYIQFYFINTRRKIGVEIDSRFCGVLADMDGRRSLLELIEKNELVLDSEVNDVIRYLMDSKVLMSVASHDDKEFEARYSRQMNFFDDWMAVLDGKTAQERISRSHCVVFGVGAVGSSVAIQLVRAGIRKITLVDYKKISMSSRERHSYFSMKMVGEYKVDALKAYLKEINSECEIAAVKERVLPNTALENIIQDSTSLVVNTADEPYIGHISVKLGRYLWGRGIPMFVAGGFDAHLMSTGDFIVPGESLCVDCCSNYFSVALKDWKPSYKIHSAQLRPNAVVGGAGGLQPMSLFSASYAVMVLINFLGGGESYRNALNRRGEFMQGSAKIMWTDIQGREGCDVCSK